MSKSNSSTNAKRKAISKKDRFEVFKRDSFMCQYCGQSAPNVTLHVDHIQPVSKGGDNSIMNLITSCQSCNLGKGDRLIDDSSVIDKQKAQLDELNEKRKQLEVMIEWRSQLKDFDNDIVLRVADYFKQETGFEVNKCGHPTIKKWLKKFEFQEILNGIDRAVTSYYKDGCHKSASLAFKKVPNICAVVRRENATGIDYRGLYYIRGIMKNRFNYVDDVKSINLMKAALDSGMEIDELKEIAITSKHWTEWRQTINEYLEGGA